LDSNRTQLFMEKLLQEIVRTGFEVLKTIKEKNLKSRVVVLTGYPYLQYRDKSKELGADYFLNKDTDIKKLGKILSVMFLKN